MEEESHWNVKLAPASAFKFNAVRVACFDFNIFYTKRRVKTKSYFLDYLVLFILQFRINHFDICCPLMTINFSFILWSHFHMLVSIFNYNSFLFIYKSRFKSFLLKLFKLFWIIIGYFLLLFDIFFWFLSYLFSTYRTFISKLAILC